MPLNLFKDILPSITVNKKSVINDAQDEKEYSPWMVNRALSLHQDMLFQANEMNKWSNLPKDAQYRYLLATIRSAKRPFVKWPSAVKDENVALIQRHFGYSRDKAVAALRILSEEQVEAITKIYADLPK